MNTGIYLLAGSPRQDETLLIGLTIEKLQVSCSMNGDDRESIRIRKYPGGERAGEWLEVDAEWYVHVKETEEAVERVRQQYGDSPRVLSIGIGRSHTDPPIDDTKRMAIAISVSETGDEPIPEFPDRFENIEIQVSREDLDDGEPL
ncbi:hypothetical protein [Haloprofundus salilacus]|uniref:hypothetical protein n=1 Tax=Haloprofundus salilacus TaxID=2876190 RepID=UPI001CCDE1DC|nr:hypothetical protein [Haloprofundus salilacus]